MIGFRDRYQEGQHTVNIGSEPLVFDAEGVLWNPTKEQIEAITSSAPRLARFERIEQAEPVAPMLPVEQPRPVRRRRAESPTQEAAAGSDSAVIADLTPQEDE